MVVYRVGYTRIPKQGLKRLHVRGKEYLYKVFPSRVVFFLQKIKIIADLEEVTGLSSDLVARGRHKKTRDGMVTPSMCKAFLQRILN